MRGEQRGSGKVRSYSIVIQRISSVLGPLLEIPTSRSVRRAWWLRLTRPSNLFQPFIDTWPDRYPEVFNFLRQEIGDSDDVNLLSFGCSTGDEVFSLRKYFPKAYIKGLDISRGNIADCRRHQRSLGDMRVNFARAGSARREPRCHYDAILCMAVFRDGRLSTPEPVFRTRRVTFQAFEQAVTELVQCLKPGGYLVVENSNFRFADCTVAPDFECVFRRPCEEIERQKTPLFGPDNRVLPSPDEVETVFRLHAHVLRTGNRNGP